MRTLWLPAVVLLAISAQPERATSGIIPFEFSGPTRWPLQSGRVIEIDYEHQKATKIVEKGSTLFEVDYPEVVTQIITSDGHKSLAFLVYRERKTLGLDYSYLLTARETAGGQIEFEKRLVSEDPIRKQQCVGELGAISDDGNTCLLKMARADREEAPYHVNRAWETWDLTVPRLLKTGLTIANGN